MKANLSYIWLFRRRRLKIFEEQLLAKHPPVMHEWFLHNFQSDAAMWYHSRALYCRSLAVMSMVGFLLGVFTFFKTNYLQMFFLVPDISDIDQFICFLFIKKKFFKALVLQNLNRKLCKKILIFFGNIIRVATKPGILEKPGV